MDSFGQILNALLRPDVVTWLSSAATVLTVVVWAVTWLQMRQSRADLIHVTATMKFEAAIESGDIVELGRYLTETLGIISIDEYAKASRAARRVDDYLTAVDRYLEIEGASSSTEPAQAPTLNLETSSSINLNDRDLPPSLVPVAQQLRNGEIWNGLARLRRDIEIRLRQFLPPDQDKVVYGPSHLIRFLRTEGGVSIEAAENLRRAIKTASRAIHGEDVSEEEASIAFYAAVQAYRSLNWNDPPPNTKILKTI